MSSLRESAFLEVKKILLDVGDIGLHMFMWTWTWNNELKLSSWDRVAENISEATGQFWNRI